MKLTTWAKQQGISTTTAWRWWKAGKLPVASEQMVNGTIIVRAHGNAQGVAIYKKMPAQRMAGGRKLHFGDNNSNGTSREILNVFASYRERFLLWVFRYRGGRYALHANR